MQQSIKVFTVEEANELIEELTKRFDLMSHINERVKSLTADIENLTSIWGKDVTEKGHVDNLFYYERVDSRDKVQKDLNDIVDEINGMGCIVKDISGLVDFYHEANGKIVCLCWKHGETAIKHWHPVDQQMRMDLKDLH
jgi:hypothetical protein